MKSFERKILAEEYEKVKDNLSELVKQGWSFIWPLERETKENLIHYKKKRTGVSREFLSALDCRRLRNFTCFFIVS